MNSFVESFKFQGEFGVLSPLFSVYEHLLDIVGDSTWKQIFSPSPSSSCHPGDSNLMKEESQIAEQFLSLKFTFTMDQEFLKATPAVRPPPRIP